MTVPVADLSATDLAAAIRRREVSPVAVVDACIARLEAVNPLLNAVVATRYGEARAAARRAEARAREPDPPPLLGVPCLVAELLAVRGMPHTAGRVARRHVVADRDATVVRRLIDAGAIVLGVTNTPEGNRVYGRTRGPHDPGSGGGLAAIVAAGGVPFGIGSDTGGALRIPAGFCGVVAHKPTGGLVPATGHAPGEGDEPLAIGPLARTVADLALVLRVIAGPDGIDPQVVRTLPADAEPDWRRVTVWPVANRSSPERAAAVHKAAFALAELGATIGTWTGPDLSEVFVGRAPVGRRAAIARLWFEAALSFPGPIPGAGRRFARADRAAATRDLREAFDRAAGPAGIVLLPIPRQTAGFDPTESPVTAVRVDTDPRGRPIGVQVAAAGGRDTLTLAAGRVLAERFGSPSPVEPPGSGSRS